MLIGEYSIYYIEWSDSGCSYKRLNDVDFVWFDEEQPRMYIRKKDGSFWTCGREVGATKKKISSGREGSVKAYICTEQFMPLVLETK